MMIRTGASPENLAIIEARIESLGGEPDTPPADPDSAPESPLTELMAERLAVVEAKRERVAALRAELAAAEADLESTVLTYATTPLVGSEDTESVHRPVPQPEAEQPTPDEDTVHRPVVGPEAEPIPEQFAAFDPVPIRAVAGGAYPRWVRGADGQRFVVTRPEHVAGGRWVHARDDDGEGDLELLTGTVAVGQVGGEWVAVCEVEGDWK